MTEAQDLKWRPGPQNPDEILTIVANDSIAGTFSAVLSDSEIDEDEIADSFRSYVNGHLAQKFESDREKVERGEHPPLTEMDLQHSVPLPEQARMLANDESSTDMIEHSVSFTRNAGAATIGTFARSFPAGRDGLEGKVRKAGRRQTSQRPQQGEGGEGAGSGLRGVAGAPVPLGGGQGEGGSKTSTP